MTIQKIKQMLADYNINPLKSRGQHFLVNEQAIRKVIHSANPQKSDTIIEIGPGLGVLTKEFAPLVSTLIAIEIDKGFFSILSDKLGNVPSIKLIHGDVLRLPLPTNIPYKLVGNLPYNIAPHILEKFLSQRPMRPTCIVVTVQKEFALRLLAKPGKMNRIGLFAQYHGTPRIIADFPPHYFWPQPNVHSSLVAIDVTPQKNLLLSLKEEAMLWRLARLAFGQPRKKIKNSLALCLPPHLQERRPQELTLEEWKALVRSL